MNGLVPTVAGFFGGWEVLLVLTIILILLAVRFGGGLFDGLRQGLMEFLKATDEVTSEIRRAREEKERSREDQFQNRLILFIAQGLGTGLIPFAPGTFGTILGIGWFALLVSTGSIWGYFGLAIEGIAFSIWLCDDAERILGQTDPGSVVLDEIVAIPFCFLPWVLTEWFRLGHVMPPVEIFFTGSAWWGVLGVFVLFRLFDIWKPWPIRRLQDLPGGWGVTVDDLLAAVYVAAVVTVVLRIA